MSNNEKQPLLTRMVAELTTRLMEPLIAKNEQIKDVYDVAKYWEALFSAIKTKLQLETHGKYSGVLSINNSVTKTHIVCQECGKNFKTLKQHLKKVHNMTAEAYINKYNLSLSYPMSSEIYRKKLKENMKERKMWEKSSVYKRAVALKQKDCNVGAI